MLVILIKSKFRTNGNKRYGYENVYFMTKTICMFTMNIDAKTNHNFKKYVAVEWKSSLPKYFFVYISYKDKKYFTMEQ